MVQLLLEPMGGAISRVAPDDSALGSPRRPLVLSRVVDVDGRRRGDRGRSHRWARELSSDLAPHTTAGVYLNFTSDDGDERVREMFGPERYAKLVALKDRYDPDNVFHLNQNIRPSRAAAEPALA